MIVTRKIQNQLVSENPHGVDVRLLYDQETAQIVHIHLLPEQALKRHITPTDVAFFVLEGSGTVEVGTEKRVVEAGTLVESPSGIVHCWYNTSHDSLRVLVVKAPRSQLKAKLL